jgi:hypothetical protein
MEWIDSRRRGLMSTTVNNAFYEFMRDKVNLDSGQTNKAKSSRDNLIENINNFSGDFDFFTVYSKKILKYGSFERKTKIRPVDDIDLMICLSGEGTRTYTENSATIYINGSIKDSDNNLLTQGTKFLNSTKVINRFIVKISELKDYSKAEMHKNQETATLQLRSYPWNFDIVPSFYTDTEVYLIPDGLGNWKKTNPRIDNSRTKLTNQKYNGNFLNLIRLFKYWNNRKITLKISSYLLECIILNQYLNSSVP